MFIACYSNRTSTSTDSTCADSTSNCSCYHSRPIASSQSTSSYRGKVKDDPDWFFFHELKIEMESDWEEVRQRQEELYRLQIILLFNIFFAVFYKRSLFSKSGFVGRTAKRRKGKI